MDLKISTIVLAIQIEGLFIEHPIRQGFSCCKPDIIATKCEIEACPK